MARRKPDRRALEGQLQASFTARGESAPGAPEVDLLHQLGQAYGCWSPRNLDRASTLYEQALALLWAAEGDRTPRGMAILASWLDCARARRETHGDAIDAEIGVMRARAEAALAEVEPRILALEPGYQALYPGAYTLLGRLGEEQRALRLLHAVSPGWAPP
jgi:hypothetical protein